MPKPFDISQFFENLPEVRDVEIKVSEADLEPKKGNLLSRPFRDAEKPKAPATKSPEKNWEKGFDRDCGL